MPPVRTISAAKPVKTERTHEENQERAYIAASRRSDRSLEARIESARRASEIHKKRTGRALRVTEQDVVNEEMYEEEDDDLPAQYRRLTAHLQTNSMDFNRRLHAYLASQHATRAALAAQYDPAFANNYGHQFTGTGQYPPQMMQPIVAPQMLPPQMFHQSPQTYRHQPYPMASTNGYRPNVHNRSASISTPKEMQNFQSPQVAGSDDEHRRMSLPPQAFQTSPQFQTDAQVRPSLSRSSTATQSVKQESPRQNHDNQVAKSPSDAATPTSQSDQNGLPYSFIPNMGLGFEPSAQNMHLGPFSMSLPAESQQLLSSAMDPNDPRTSMYMAGSEMIPQPFYSYNPNPTSKQRTSASSAGMDQTLAPGAAIHVETGIDASAMANPPSATTATDGLMTPFTPSFNSYDFNNGFNDSFKSATLTRNNSAQGSADGMTPGEWSNLIDGSIWEAAP